MPKCVESLDCVISRYALPGFVVTHARIAACHPSISTPSESSLSSRTLVTNEGSVVAAAPERRVTPSAAGGLAPLRLSQRRQLAPSIPPGPVGPVAPSGPEGPVGPPGSPSGPCGPVAPVSPEVPDVPLIPLVPEVPDGPEGPVAPPGVPVAIQEMV